MKSIVGCPDDSFSWLRNVSLISVNCDHDPLLEKTVIIQPLLQFQRYQDNRNVSQAFTGTNDPCDSEGSPESQYSL